ncbi:MAG: hypothetical protein K2L15_03855 [Eubacteriales bacterium]|nr:hypothetical protein [Eubacteriales bacterium]
MEILKIKRQIQQIVLQQFSSNSVYLEFIFNKEINISFQDALIEIIFDDIKLTSNMSDIITVVEDEDTIAVKWKVENSMTKTPGIKKTQIVIKDADIVYLSSVFEITVLKSLEVDNTIVVTDWDYLEYWENRIDSAVKKVESGGIDNSILETFQTKEDNSLNTNDKSIVGAINEIKSNISELPKQEILAGNGIEIKNNAVNIKVDDKTIGFNGKGELEARLFTGGDDEGNTNIKQYLIKDVKSGQIYTVNDEGLPVNHKVIPCVLALENSKTNFMEITNFKLNIEDIISNNGIYIQNVYDYEVKNNESPVINKGEFNEILGIKGGV